MAPVYDLVFLIASKDHTYKTNAQAISYTKEAALNITAKNIRYWHNLNTVGGYEELRNPSSQWVNNGDPYSIEAVTKSGAGTFKSFAVSGYNGNDLNSSSFSLSGVKVISINGNN